MPRSNRRRQHGRISRHDDDAPDGRPVGVDSTEQWRGTPYVVRRLSGSAGKTYRCPGCDQEVAPAAPHVVTWPAHDTDAADRRHWHTGCWAAREHRHPTVQRPRNAPRY